MTSSISVGFLTISIPSAGLVFVLLLGVTSPRHISYYDNSTVKEPIIGRAAERRICAELCMSGLGGEPCGADCFDMVPEALRNTQYAATTADERSSALRRHHHVPPNNTREDACPLLCGNRLGYPLCDCRGGDAAPSGPFFRVDYVGICSFYCTKYDYQIYGCDLCENYKKELQVTSILPQVNWTAWCGVMCKENEGGAACHCDKLPLMLEV